MCMLTIDFDYVKAALPPRDPAGHKGDFGKVYVLGGSVGYTGAPVFCSRAAVRSGCGLVFLGVPSDIWQVAAEIARLAEAARSGRATRDELSGSTITLTSLGPLGGIVSTPVINRPEVAIVGVNRIVERPAVVDGRIDVRKLMNLSSSFDHRVVDGAVGAEYLQALKGFLENPATMLAQ